MNYNTHGHTFNQDKSLIHGIRLQSCRIDDERNTTRPVQNRWGMKDLSNIKIPLRGMKEHNRSRGDDCRFGFGNTNNRSSGLFGCRVCANVATSLDLSFGYVKIFQPLPLGLFFAFSPFSPG